MKGKTRVFNASLITLLLTIGLLVGGWIARIDYIKQLDEIRHELTITQENLELYKVAYEEALGYAQYEYEVNEYLEMDLAEAQSIIANFTDEECKFVYFGDLHIGTEVGQLWFFARQTS